MADNEVGFDNKNGNKNTKTKRKLVENDIIIYIVPARIQSKRLHVLKKYAESNNYKISDNFSTEVTHIITEFVTREQVLKFLSLSKVEATSLSAKILTTQWLTDSIKEKRIIAEYPQLHQYQIKSETKHSKIGKISKNEESVQGYACQRKTLLNHKNVKLVHGLEILARHAEFRDSDEKMDGSRALAFRKAAAVLKFLPFEVKHIEELENLGDIGDHSMRIIQDILEDGISSEVQDIVDSDYFKTMEIFNAVYGIGSVIANKLFDKGLRSIEQLRKMPEMWKKGNDNRIDYGLAFFEDLVCLTLSEAQRIFLILNTVAQTILPGIRVDLTGGFRRGKTEGHDADFLFSHPEEGAEIGFLSQLYKKLVSMGFILHGQIFSSEYFKKLGKNSTMDSFEKCFCIFRCPTNDNFGLQDMASLSAHKTSSKYLKRE